MVAEPPVSRHPERTGLGAQVLLPLLAGPTAATADPRIDHTSLADLDTAGVGTARHHRAANLMTQRQRQLAAPGQIEPLAVAHVEEAVPQVQIAVTDTTGLDLDEHLRPDRIRAGSLGPFERLAVARELITDHRPLTCLQPVAQVPLLSAGAASAVPAPAAARLSPGYGQVSPKPWRRRMMSRSKTAGWFPRLGLHGLCAASTSTTLGATHDIYHGLLGDDPQRLTGTGQDDPKYPGHAG